MAIQATNVRSREEAAFQVLETTINDIHAAYSAGTLTARQLVQTYLNRIATYDKSGPAINTIISLNAHALEEADRLDSAFEKSGPVGPLHGIPLLMKDQANIKGCRRPLALCCSRTSCPPATASWRQG
jgi:amidase